MLFISAKSDRTAQVILHLAGEYGHSDLRGAGTSQSADAIERYLSRSYGEPMYLGNGRVMLAEDN